MLFGRLRVDSQARLSVTVRAMGETRFWSYRRFAILDSDSINDDASDSWILNSYHLREFFWISAICMTTEKFAADILRRLLHLAKIVGDGHVMNVGQSAGRKKRGSGEFCEVARAASIQTLRRRNL